MVEPYDRVLLWYFSDRFLAFSSGYSFSKSCLIPLILDELVLLYVKKDNVKFHLVSALLYEALLVRTWGSVMQAVRTANLSSSIDGTPTGCDHV